MADFVEVDFLDVETDRSGDAITLRYSVGGATYIHVVDGGFSETTPKIIEHLKVHYDAPTYIDHMVLTHADMDHANGLRGILEEYDVGTLWMLRPWTYATELLPRFATYNSVDALRNALKNAYKPVADLEEIANKRGVQIREPFQGQQIGAFRVLAPTRKRYLDMIVESPKTPEAKAVEALRFTFKNFLEGAAQVVKSLVAATWGHEYFPTSNTGPENETSVVQYAFLNDRKILLTGDVGRDGLAEAADFAPNVGLTLPGIDCFQVPHHGGRHNVNTELLDRWLGPRLATQPSDTTFSAICSSAKKDTHHPKKSVIRAMLHRGAHFAATEGNSVLYRAGLQRAGWNSIPQTAYPNEQEED